MGKRAEIAQIRTLIAIVALAIGLMIGGAVGWFMKPKETIEVPGPTETTTVTTTVTTIPTPTPTPVPTPTPTPVPTVSTYLTKFILKPELFRSHTKILYVLFGEEDGQVLGNLTGILRFTRVGYTVHASLNYSLEADPIISNVTFESGIAWYITKGPEPVPMPFPIGGGPYTWGDNESASIEMKESDDFEQSWEWVQFSAKAVIHNFEVGFVDGQVWRGGEGSETYDLTYLINTGQDLFQFLYNNPIESSRVFIDLAGSSRALVYYLNKVDSWNDLIDNGTFPWTVWNRKNWLENTDHYIELSTFSAYSQPYSCKQQIYPNLENDWSRRCNFRVNYDPSMREYWAYSWHYYPSDWPYPPWASITAWKEYYITMGKWELQVYSDGYLRIRGQRVIEGNHHNLWKAKDEDGNLVKMPLGVWFRTCIHVIRDHSDGLVEFYLNNKCIFRMENVKTSWNNWGDSEVNWWFSASMLYTDTTSPPCWKLFDDVIVTSVWRAI